MGLKILKRTRAYFIINFRLKEKEYELNPIATLDPLVVSPLGRLRVKKLVSSFIAKQNEEKKKVTSF